MQAILNNTPLLCLAIVIFVVVVGVIYWFRTTPTEDKKQALKEWLKWAVTLAEKELGGGTGQLKLRKVYEMALQQFPWIINCVSFEEFSAYVDEALEWMRDQLTQNKDINAFVEGGD